MAHPVLRDPGRTTFTWILFGVALLMLSLILVPAESWHHSANDAVYTGFDRSLVFVDERGGAPAQGIVEVLPGSLSLTAVPNSQPTVHLATTSLNKLQATMNVRILEDQNGVPFRIGIWTPRGNHGVFVVFDTGAVALQTVSAGQVVSTKTLGTYSPGQLYGLEMSLDKETKTLRTRIRGGLEAPPYGGKALWIVGKALPLWYSHIFSPAVAVAGGRDYSFGGAVKLVHGFEPYGFVVEWRDGKMMRLAKSEEWHQVQDLAGWTAKEFTARAPAGARFAVLEIATAPGTDMLFGDVFLKESEHPQVNLLPDGDFRQGAPDWRRGTAESIPLVLLSTAPVNYGSIVSYEALPELFDELRLSLTVSATSGAGISGAIVDNYALTLPHQHWLAARTDDGRAKALIVLLVFLGVALCADRVVRWTWPKVKTWMALWRAGLFGDYLRPALPLWWSPKLIALLAGALAYLILNSLLFNAGSLNYDLLSGTVWAYTSVRYGVSALYHLPVVTSIPEAWGGVPIQEAGFPYLPVMAYITLAVGWVYKIFFAQPGVFVRNAFQLAFVIKTFTALFSFGSAILIYLILREQKVGVRWSLLAAGFFLFSPAVWFVGSVWGQTQSWSIFFLLLAIWFGERRMSVVAWLALTATALTRQQMLVPAALLALVFLKRFPIRENLRAIAWSVVLAFLVLAPFSLRIGPSLVMDVLNRTFGFHVQESNDRWTTLVSWGALSIWPIITLLVDGQTGLNRIFYSSRAQLVGGLAHWQVGNILFGGLFVAVAAILLLRRASAARPSNHIPALAFGTLGLFLLKTEFTAFHLLPVLALVILCRKSMDTLTYCAAVGILTITIFVPMYSIAGIWMSYNAPLSVGLFDPASPVTGFFKGFMTSDWFISLGSLANVLVLFWLGIVTVWPLVGVTTGDKFEWSPASSAEARPAPRALD